MRRLHIYLGFAIGISGLCAARASVCTPPPALQTKLQAQPSADAYAELGIWYSNHRQFGCAAGAYEAALKRQPNSPEFWYSLGLSLLRKGDFNDAIKPLRKSIELKPDVIKPHLLLATALEELRRGPEARTEWLAAIKIDPQSEMALDGASKNYLASHDFGAVIARLDPQPKSETLVLDLASAYRGTGNTDDAIEVLKKGLDANPSSGPITRELITNLFSQRRYGEAATLGKKLVENSPRDLDAQVLYLHVLVLNGDDNLARPLAHKLFTTAPHNFGVLYLNGVLEDKSGNYAGGRTFLEEAVKLNPNDYDSRYNLGIALSNLNNPREAKEQFEKALSLGEPEPGVHVEYARVLRALGETQLAAEQIKLYQQEQKAQSDSTQAAISMGQGDKELAAGNSEKAAEFYRSAIAIRPDDALLHYKLSIALDKVGDTTAERAALEKAVQIDPHMAIAHRQLGYLAFNSGDFSTAEQQFREAVKAAPRYADAWISLAATLATESRHSEAVEAIRRALEIDPQNANALELQKELANASAAPTNQ